MIPLQVAIALALAALYIYAVAKMVYACFGPQYIECKCGAHVRVSEDGWFYWECDECGESGKAHPFQ